VICEVAVQTEDFDPVSQQRELLAGNTAAGAVASFVGLVRSDASSPVLMLELEHYPGMTERSIRQILEQASGRWDLLGARVVHRVGRLTPGDQIVYVGVASAHRGHAFAACEFIMDFLKTEAPFWKKETTPTGTRWVDARCSDGQARERWEESSTVLPSSDS
jgi:molybdopterin synthase catalytic subunit